MKGYENANGDKRGILDRFLPTPFRSIGQGSETHNAFLGAIKSSILTTEQELSENVKQVYLNYATGKLLDLYGKWIGIARRDNELDESYRDRLINYITKQRVTIAGIIQGIKDELDNNDLNISIYEPWRNIFILNKSLLNGPDRIMGEFYRYAIIQVILDDFIPQSQLTKILDKYKAAGVQIFYSFNNGMSFGDELISISLQNIYMDYKKSIINPLYFKDTFGINDLPTGELNKDIFTTNISDINGKDVLAGSPENTYAYQYGSVPSKNIFGVVDQAVNPSSYTDPYDYIYQNTKVDLSTIGGRNYILDTGNPKTQTSNGNDNQDFYDNARFYSPLKNWGIATGDYIISFDWTLKTALTNDMVLRLIMNQSPWQNFVVTIPANKISGHANITFKLSEEMLTTVNDVTSLTFRIMSQMASGNTITYSNLFMKSGKSGTWTPAPEDTPKTYIYPYKNNSFVNLGSKDNISETLLKQGNKSLTIALNVEEYLNANQYKGILSSFNQSNIAGIILDVYGSPYGVSETEISATSPNSATPIPGSWYTYDKQVLGKKLGSKIPQSSNSTSSYLFKFDSPTSVNSIVINDFYYGVGALRSLSLFDGNNSIRIKTTKEQTLGTTLVNPILSLNANIIKSYITEVNLDMLPEYPMQAYNKEMSKWVNISSDTDLTPYLINGEITGGSYILLRIASPGTSPSIDYIGLSLRGFINHSQ